MNPVKSIVTLVIATLCVFAVNAVADTLAQKASKPVITPMSLTVAKDSQNMSDIAETAKRWGLSVSDFRRYTEIVNGPLGRWNPTIDPVLALGIYAENEVDQQRYAELYAQQEYELTQRTQAFERAYHAAFRRLYPDVSLIDKQWLQHYYDRQQRKAAKQVWNTTAKTALAPPRFQAGDRLLYFPRIDCQDCGRQIRYWRTLLQPLHQAGIDIYVREAESADQVRRWAKLNRIEPTWIQERFVTLNRDAGLSATLAKKVKGKGSSVYLSRGDSIFALNPEQLGL